MGPGRPNLEGPGTGDGGDDGDDLGAGDDGDDLGADDDGVDGPDDRDDDPDS